MSEIKSEAPKRTLEDVQKEYNNLAFRAGHLQYEIAVKTKDLGMINDGMKSLAAEGSKLQAQAVLDKQKEAEAAQPPKLEGVN